MVKLDVLIVTYGDSGLEMVRKMNLPMLESVRYIVAWQRPPDGAPESIATRDDIEIYKFNDAGSSRNHNHTIELARAPYCLLADNDLEYTKEQLLAIIDTFEKHPDIDVATFKYEPINRFYPSEATDLTTRIPKGYTVNMCVISYRRDKLGDVRFNELFGINAPFRCAEDEVFFHDCRAAGLCCWFFPIVITRHDHLSTGERPVTDPAMAKGMGALLRHIYPFFSGMLRVPLLAWRNYKKGRLPLVWGLKNIMSGFLTYNRILKQNKNKNAPSQKD